MATTKETATTPEEVTLSDGTVVRVQKDFVRKSADGAEEKVPFLVQLIKENGDSLSYVADDAEHAATAQSLCVELDKLGFVRR